MKAKTAILMFAVILSACSPCQRLVRRCPSTSTSITTADSLHTEIMRLRAEKTIEIVKIIDTILLRPLPIERVLTYCPDTAYAETSFAFSEAYLDSLTGQIKLTLANKGYAQVQYRIEYLDREKVVVDTAAIIANASRLSSTSETIVVKSSGFKVFLEWSGGVLWVALILTGVIYVSYRVIRKR